MKKDLLNLPFLLLVTFIGYSGFFIKPDIAHSFIAIALSSLYGFQLYVNFKTPDPKSDLTVEAKEMQDEMKKLQYERENLKIKLDIKRMNGQIASNDTTSKGIAF
jgi:hypothetical protein